MSGAPKIFSPDANPDAKIDFGVVGEAFKLFVEQAVNWIITLIVVGVINGILYALLLSLDASASQSGGNPAVLFIVNAVTIIINMLFVIGLLGMAINQIRGESMSVMDLFDFVDVAWQTIVAGILLWLIISIATAFCFIPGLIAGGLLMFTFPLIADQKMNPLGALSSSINALSEQWILATVFYVLFIFFSTIGFAFLLIGAFVTVPVGILSLALLYHNFYFGAPGRVTDNSGGFEPPFS